jgi:hypothetical protein
LSYCLLERIHNWHLFNLSFLAKAQIVCYKIYFLPIAKVL